MDIRFLIDSLNHYTELYDRQEPIISDKAWDEMYFQLKKEEEESGIIYPDSPTQKIHYEDVSKLNKITHDHSMLSLDKTKNINDIEAFLDGQDFITMFKMDGLTCSLTYENGKLVRAETRGNGLVGEDILHNAKVVKNIPLTIPYTEKLVVDGEIICRKDDFITFEKEYKNPRNFAAGSIRLLSSKECKKRNLSFIAWEMIEGYPEITDFCSRLAKLHFSLGFDIVPMVANSSNVKEALETIKDNFIEVYAVYPIDGYVFKFNDIEYGKSKGQTDHHLKNAMAYKLYDETYSTKLKYIEWTLGRTGVLTPIAVFDPIEIDGSTVERASLHNVSVMRQILGDCAYAGEPLEIYKANQIIPQVSSAGPKYDYSYVICSANDDIKICPVCGGEVNYITSEDGVINAYCTNPQCEGKLKNRLEHFCGKKGLDIKGISKATFEKLVNWGWIENLEDVFSLVNHRKEWINKPGFGVASVDKILKSIEEAKNTTLNAFISAIGIPLIGRTAAKVLAENFETYENFKNAVMDDSYYFFTLDDFGEEMNNSIKKFDYEEADRIASILTFKPVVKKAIPTDSPLAGKNIVITGKLKTFKNRAELKSIIESCGGKVSSSISSKTDILINNDINSNSSKNKFAKENQIPILSEAEFVERYVEK